MDIRQYAVTLLCFCFPIRKYTYSTELQDPAEELYHKLAISFWNAVLPQATSRLRQDNRLPLPSNDFLRQGPKHPFKGRIRVHCSPITIILSMSQHSTKHLTSGTASN